MKTNEFPPKYMKSEPRMTIIRKKFNSRKNFKMPENQNNKLIFKKNKKNK